MSATTQEPQGIAFFSIKTGETHHAKLEPTIAAYINSSDMGINASAGQDYGWRLGKEWVEKVRKFKKDPTAMSILASQNGGTKPNSVQILHYIYSQQMREYYEAQEEQEAPYQEQYRQDISEKLPADDSADLIDEVLAESEPKPAPKPAPKAKQK